MRTNLYPIFSIIIPVYNVEKYVGYCLQSVCDQDLEKNLFEIIVVDDCSPDASCDVVERIIAEYPDTQIKLIHHDVNKHLGGSRNTGLLAANGEYILWVDSDDCFIYKNTLSTLCKVLENTDINVLRTKHYTGIRHDYFEPLKVSNYKPEVSVYSTHEYLNLPHFGMHAHSSVYKRKFLQDNGIHFRENHGYEDSDWSHRVNYKAKQIYEIDFPFYGYRHRDDSITTEVNVNHFMDNALSVVAAEKVAATEIGDPVIQTDIRDRIKISLYSFIKISRLYRLKDSLKCVSCAYRDPDLDLTKYISSTKDRIILNTMKRAPLLILLPVRVLYRMKWAIRNTLKK